jgi:hypothetical protein
MLFAFLLSQVFLWWEFVRREAYVKKLIQQAKAVWAQAKAMWASLPHEVQAGAIVFVTAASTTLGKELQALIFGTAHFTRSSLQHDIGAACVAGALAARAFYMLPNRQAANALPVSPGTPTEIQPSSSTTEKSS